MSDTLILAEIRKVVDARVSDARADTSFDNLVSIIRGSEMSEVAKFDVALLDYTRELTLQGLYVGRRKNLVDILRKQIDWRQKEQQTPEKQNDWLGVCIERPDRYVA